jgi:hypothetical protein
MIPDGFGGEIAGTRTIRVELSGVDPMLMLTLVGKRIILLMEDQRRLPMFASGPDTFTARGGFSETE